MFDSYKKIENRYNYMNLSKVMTVTDLKKSYFYQNILNEHIYFNNPLYFNDEYEFEIETNKIDWIEFLIPDKIELKRFNSQLKANNNDYDLALSKCANSFIEKHNKIIDSFNTIIKDTFKDIKSNFGVFCLAPSYNYDYFWKEYAGDYKGVCCEYDIESIFNSNIDNVILGRVEYGEKLSLLPEHISPMFMSYQELSKIYSPKLIKRFGTKIEERKNIIISSMFIKHKKWQCEYENRLILKMSNNSSDNERFVSAIPKKIYIGYKLKEEIINEIISLCNTKNIKYEIIKYK